MAVLHKSAAEPDGLIIQNLNKVTHNVVQCNIMDQWTIYLIWGHLLMTIDDYDDTDEDDRG